jgi:pimeloyl-ACP methyl ester carboxylesterase
MISSRPFSLDVAGRRIHGLVDSEAGSESRPTVVLCHGFKGFMEWGFFPVLANLLATRGFCVVRFNFSSSGMRPGDELVTDPAAFRDATFSRDLDELVAVIASVGIEIAPATADPGRLGLFGHSRGGGLAILAAAGGDSVRALVTWAAIATFERVSAAERESWRAAGAIPIVNSRTGQQLELGSAALEDLEVNASRLDIEAAATRRRVPWLVVHGLVDDTVPAAEAKALESAASPPVELLELPSADHTFGARHPFAGPTPQLTTALDATQVFFRRHL